MKIKLSFFRYSTDKVEVVLQIENAGCLPDYMTERTHNASDQEMVERAKSGVTLVEEKEAEEPLDECISITSPFIGIVHMDMENNDVMLGAYIQKDDVVCTVEAIKLYNDVKSPVAGVIVEILVEGEAKLNVDRNYSV